MDGHRKLAALAVGAALVAAAGCGKVADKVASKAASHATGDKIDINGNKVSATDKDGNSVQVNGDGSSKINTKDGSFSSGSGTKLPDGWPKALDPPSGTVLTTASTTKDGTGGTIMAVSGEVKGSVPDVAAGLKSQVTGAGYDVQSSGDSGGGSFLVATDAKTQVSAQVTAGSDSGTSTVIITISPKGD